MFLLINASRLLRFVQPNIIRINTSVFTARVLSRPQHGMWPTRWLSGPFLFLNHLIFCPLRWKLTPLNQRSRNWCLRYQFHGKVRRLVFLKRHMKKDSYLESLWLQNQLRWTASSRPVCSCCEIKGLDNCLTNADSRPCSYLTSLLQGRD